MKNILLIISVFSLLFAYGCSENPEYSALFHTVEGTVIDRNGKPIPGIKAYIGSYRLTSNADGKFLFNAIQDPYDLQLTYTSSSGKPTGVLYTSLFNEKVTLELMDYGTTIAYSTNISVTLPSAPSNSRYLIFVTDSRNFTLFRTSTTSLPSTLINWIDSVNINARVMVLVQNLSTMQYDNFASKNIVLMNNQNIDVAFTSGDFNFDPTDIPISGNINSISGYSTPNSQLNFRFTDGPGLFGDAIVAFTSASAVYNYFIPGNLPVNAQYIVSARAEGATAQFSVNTITYDPKFPIQHITLFTPPQQTEPVNNATGINYSTFFTYTDGGGNGIYRIQLESSARQFYVFTRATSFKIPSFPNNPEVIMSSNENYTWQIIKLLNINNVDELVRKRLNSQNDFSGATASEIYGFTTQP